MPRHPRFYITKEREQYWLWRARVSPEFKNSRLYKRVKLIKQIQVATAIGLVIGLALVFILGR